MSPARNRKSRSSRQKKSTESTPSPSKRKLTVWRVLFALFVLSMLLLSAQLWHLNQLIENRFEGETWARPSRVYARPLELYAGLKVKPFQIRRELEMAGYQRTRHTAKAGQYASSDQAIEVYLREFHFPDHFQPEEKIRIEFTADAVHSVTRLPSGNLIEFLQLTPAIIGSFIPGNHEDRLVVEPQDIPDQLIDILLTIEDRGFYQHMGISPMSIARALWANIRAGKTVQGGSTLTQQLAKNLFLTPERSLWRKINEATLAIMLEYRFDKHTILAAYVNEVFLLQHKNVAVHGFALASRLLFKQPLKALSTDQLALLVGMVKGPSIYNPIAHPDNASQRRNQVLKVLFDAGKLSEAELNRYQARPLAVNKKLPPINPYPAYLDLVKRQLSTYYSSDDLSARGLHIFSAFDPIKQAQLELGLENGLKRFESSTEDIQTAVVISDYLSGDLVAMVGDRDTDYPGFNRAILAQRPIGSLIKPLLLYGLLQQGDTLATLVQDRIIRIKQSNGDIWSPQNYDRKLHGDITLYEAFIRSYNLPFVRRGLDKQQLPELVDNLQKINLLKQSTIYPSLLLGAMALTPFEVAQMYQVIANSGYFTPLTTIRQVMDNQHELLSKVPLASESLYDRSSMIQVQRAMIGVTEQGTARYLKQRFPELTLAGKTGTTNDLRDSWFSGFSSRYLTVVWLGNDDNQSIKLSGSSGALRVWADIMQQIDVNSLKLGIDPTLQWTYVNQLNGGLSEKDCVNSVILPFKKGMQPDHRSNCEQHYLDKGIQWFQDLF